MIEQLKTIREALVLGIKAINHLGGAREAMPLHDAMPALDQLEAMVVEPYGTVTVVRKPGCADMHWFYRWPDPPYLDNAAECHTVYTAAPVAQQHETVTNDEQARAYMDARLWEFIDMAGMWPKAKPDPRIWAHVMVYAPPAQQPQARPDFTDEWTGYLKDGETPFERFLRERKDLTALTKLYQRALEENERLKAQQRQAEEATSAGLEASISILSQLVDEQRQLLAEVDAVFGVDAHGIVLEDGDSALIDRVRAHLAATSEAKQPQAEAVPPGFVAFARDVLADFPHGFPDDFDLNDLAIKHGLLIGKTVTERCGELCNCAEYHGEDELKGGVTCYHRHAAIAQQKGGV